MSLFYYINFYLLMFICTQLIIISAIMIEIFYNNCSYFLYEQYFQMAIVVRLCRYVCKCWSCYLFINFCTSNFSSSICFCCIVTTLVLQWNNCAKCLKPRYSWIIKITYARKSKCMCACRQIKIIRAACSVSKITKKP
jgi:hypothetical protein